jgi:hypothetical protein
MFVSANRTKRFNHFSLEALGDHDSIDIERSVLIESIVDFVNALKVNSTLKSLKVICDKFDTMDGSGASAIADILRVNSALESLYLGDNRRHQVGTEVIDDALKINARFTNYCH